MFCDGDNVDKLLLCSLYCCQNSHNSSSLKYASAVIDCSCSHHHMNVTETLDC